MFACGTTDLTWFFIQHFQFLFPIDSRALLPEPKNDNSRPDKGAFGKICLRQQRLWRNLCSQDDISWNVFSVSWQWWVTEEFIAPDVRTKTPHSLSLLRKPGWWFEEAEILSCKSMRCFFGRTLLFLWFTFPPPLPLSSLDFLMRTWEWCGSTAQPFCHFRGQQFIGSSFGAERVSQNWLQCFTYVGQLLQPAVLCTGQDVRLCPQVCHHHQQGAEQPGSVWVSSSGLTLKRFRQVQLRLVHGGWPVTSHAMIWKR